VPVRNLREVVTTARASDDLDPGRRPAADVAFVSVKLKADRPIPVKGSLRLAMVPNGSVEKEPTGHSSRLRRLVGGSPGSRDCAIRPDAQPHAIDWRSISSAGRCGPIAPNGMVPWFSGMVGLIVASK
jgi:hypothetical protein